MADQTRGCAYACEVEAAPRAVNPTREFSRPGIHTPPARVRCGAGVRRYCRVATTDESHLGFCLLPPARLGSAVRQRLREKIYRGLGAAAPSGPPAKNRSPPSA